MSDEIKDVSGGPGSPVFVKPWTIAPGFAINLPFPTGTQVKVTAGYGPSNGSPNHTGIASTTQSEDWCALDLIVVDSQGRPTGAGGSVLAAAAGTVVYAQIVPADGQGGWGAGYGNLVVVEHPPVTATLRYYSFYAHLGSFSVKVGDAVTTATELGKVGNTGNSSGPHLHFSLQANIEMRDPWAPWGGWSVRPEPLGGHSGIQPGNTYTV